MSIVLKQCGKKYIFLGSIFRQPKPGKENQRIQEFVQFEKFYGWWPAGCHTWGFPEILVGRTGFSFGESGDDSGARGGDDFFATIMMVDA